MKRLRYWNLFATAAVLSVIWSLVAMSLSRERVNTRANQCASRLKNVSLAAVQHDFSRNCLPGYVQDFGTYSGDGADRSDPTNNGVPRHKKLGTWAVAVLPWLDAHPTYEHWTRDRYPIIIADPKKSATAGVNKRFCWRRFSLTCEPPTEHFPMPIQPC